MDKLLDLATIKIDLKMRGNYLAQVSLSWDKFEVRFFRITISSSGLWFQSPASGQSMFKCFIVKDKNQWHELQRKVIELFLKELTDKVKEGVYTQDLLDKLKKDDCKNFTEGLSQEDIDKIDKAITNNHL